MNTIADRLRIALKKRAMKVADIIRAGGPSRPTIYRIMNDPSYEPEGYTLSRLAETLGVSFEWLFKGEGPMLADDCREDIVRYQVDPPALDQALMESAILAVLKLLEVRKLTLSPERTVAGILAVYEAARTQGRSEITEADVAPLVRLLMA